MNTDRVISAVVLEAASVRKLRERLSPAEFNQRVRDELHPYFRTESALDSLIKLKTHIWEFGVILDMKGVVWFRDGLDFFIQQFNHAKQSDQANVERSLTEWFPKLNSALARYSEAFHLEQLDSTMDPHLLTRSAFRQLGDVLEGCFLPFIRQVYSLLCIAGHGVLHHNPSSATFGNLVSGFCTSPSTRILYQDLLRGVPIHQWRNIAQHSSYTCHEKTKQIECVYGLPHKQRTITLSIPELLELLIDIDRIFALHKIAVGFFTVDSIELLRGIKQCPVTKDTVVGMLLSFFETHGLRIDEFDTSGDPWTVSLVDIRWRSEQEVKRLLSHTAQFTAVRPDVRLHFLVKTAHGHGRIQGEIRKRKPNKTDSGDA